MPTPNNSSTPDAHQKLKRSIALGVLVTLAIVGWHLYEYLIYGKSREQNAETPLEHQIVELTQQLFAEELKHGSGYLERLDLQGRTKSHLRDDRAPNTLIHVNELEQIADKSSTIVLLKRLFDNYELDSRTKEVHTGEEQQEELDFLQAIMKTSIMKRTMKFLQHKDIVTADYNEQLQLLHDLWFTQYSRGKQVVGSSSFEHVFLAEIKDRHSVLGLHNWIYFGEQEQNGHLDYKGYINAVELDKLHHLHFLTLRFSFHDLVKPYNSMFIGTSPELELSLYTVCFLLRMDQTCTIQLGPARLIISTYSWDWHGKKLIGSAFPSLENE